MPTNRELDGGGGAVAGDVVPKSVKPADMLPDAQPLPAPTLPRTLLMIAINKAVKQHSQDNTRLKAEAATLQARLSELERLTHERSAVPADVFTQLDERMRDLNSRVATSKALSDGLQSQVNELTNSNKILKATVTLLRTEYENRIDALVREMQVYQLRVIELETQLPINPTMMATAPEEDRQRSAEKEADIIARCESQIRSLTNTASAENNAATAVFEARIRSLSDELANVRELVRQQDLPKTSRESGAPSDSPRSPGYRIRGYSPSLPRSGEPSSHRRSPDRLASPEELQVLVRAIMMSRGVQIRERRQ